MALRFATALAVVCGLVFAAGPVSAAPAKKGQPAKVNKAPKKKKPVTTDEPQEVLAAETKAETKKEEPKKEEPKKVEEPTSSKDDDDSEMSERDRKRAEKKREKREKEERKEREKAEARKKRDHWKSEPEVDVASGESPTIEPRPKSRALEPGHVDAKLIGSADILLAYVGIGAAVDVGVARPGRGTISAGLSAEYATCLSVCWALGEFTSFDFNQNHITVLGRGGYHFDFGWKRMDLHPFMMIGPTFASATLSYDNGAVEYKANDIGIAVGAGAAFNFFINDHFFVGAEGRARYAAGTYKYEIAVGKGDDRYHSASTSSWSMSGVDFVLALGGRF